jgi:hypothetical protein
VQYPEPSVEAEAWQSGSVPHDGDVELREASGGAAPVGGVVRRGHLTVIDGGG